MLTGCPRTTAINLAYEADDCVPVLELHLVAELRFVLVNSQQVICSSPRSE